MQVSEEFQLQPVQQQTRALPEERANELAFYTAGSYSEEPIDDYQNIKLELETQGYSQAVDAATKRWISEQDAEGKEYFTALIGDPSVSVKDKKEALALYSVGGYISKDIKDKYVEKVAVLSPGDTLQADLDQDELLKVLESKLQDGQAEALLNDVANSEVGVKNYAEGLWFVTKDIAKSVPAVVWGALQGIWDKDLITGQEVVEQTLADWNTDPTDPRSQQVRQNLLEKLSVLGIPYEFAVSKVLEATGSEQAAIASGLAVEAALFKGASVGIKGTAAAIKGRPRVKPDSPLGNTVSANPKVGGDFAAAAVLDGSEQAARAMGTDAGAIISDMVFPNPVGMAERRHLPSLDQRIQANLAEVDPVLIKTLEDFRFDPSIQSQSIRQADYQTVLSITQSNRGPSYMPALSTITPTKASVYEGRAVFGKSKDFFYNSRTHVINDYNILLDSIKNIPGELQSTLVIRDRVTGKAYTPDTLKTDASFFTRENLLNSFPSEYKGVPVRVGKVTDENGAQAINKNGNPIKGAVVKTEIGEIKELVIDPDQAKKFYADVKDQMTAKGITTPEEFAQFVLQHEKAHVDFPRASLSQSMTDVEYEAFINNKAIEYFNQEFPRDKKSAAKQFTLEWDWKREYSDLSAAIFGPDAVQTSFVGADVSALARSSLSQWIFGGRGIFPRWFEMGAARAAPRAAKQAAPVLEILRKKIAGTPYKKELSDIVNLAETTGREAIPIKELQDKFPYLKKSQVEDLYETHAYWRRVNHFNHALINLQYRTELVNEGFSKGLFVNGEYKGAVNSNIKFDSESPVPRDVWDSDLDIKIKFTLDTSKTDGTYDVGGKQLVQLKKPISDENGDVYRYVLTNGPNSKIDLLPDQVVPRIPGYSPVKTEAYWYVDIIPTSLIVDGFNVSDPKVLRNYTQTKAASLTEAEAKILEQEFKDTYPNHVVLSRLDRQVSFGRIVADQEAHGEILRNAMQRGERLKTIDGAPLIEDRLTSLVNSVQTLTRQNSLQVWDDATQKAFVNSYSDFLPYGQFPRSVNEIVGLPNMSREEAKQFNNAVTIFKHYEKIKSFGTLGDRAWSGAFNALADIFEKWKFTDSLAPVTRDVARKGNVLAEGPRQAASVMYINLNPIRQWLIQPAQLMELYAINPQTAIQRMSDLAAVRVALASSASILGKNGDAYYNMARKMAPTMSKQEFDDTVKAIRESGILESVDLNMLVHGVFNDVDRAMVEGTWAKAFNNVMSVPKSTSRLARSVGFDFAELNNRIGLWLIARDRWVKNNPGKDWRTPEAVTNISFDEWNLSGSMTRAGAYPYQSGAWAVLMQFAAITQKLTMNLIQDNATVLTKSERARLVGTRAAMWGTKYGLPGGALAYHYIDKSEDEDIKKYADVLKRGLMDRATGHLLMALTGSESADILTARGMTPYNDLTTGIPYIELAYELYKIVDGDPNSARFPAVGALSSLYEIKGRMESWFITQEITEVNAFEKATKEAFSVASGMNNWAKAQLMLSIKDKITRNGNKLGLDATAAEAWAQAAGFITWREEELWDALSANFDRKQKIDDMAGQIHQWIINQEKELGFGVDLDKRLAMINAFVSMLKDDKEWTDQEITELWPKILDKDQMRYKDTGTSLLESYLKSNTEKNDADLQQVKNTLRANGSKEVQDLLDILDGKGNP